MTIISRRVVDDAIARRSVSVMGVDLPDREFVLITHPDRPPTLAQSALKDHLLEHPDPLDAAAVRRHR